MHPHDPKKLLWANICRLLNVTEPTLEFVRKKLSLTPGTTQRIKDQQTSIGLETLENIATKLRVEVYELMRPPSCEEPQRITRIEQVSLEDALAVIVGEMRGRSVRELSGAADAFRRLTEDPDEGAYQENFLTLVRAKTNQGRANE